MLLDEGANVVVSGRSAARADALRVIGGDRLVVVEADNADPDTAERLRDVALTEFGRLDGALISVGGPPGALAMDATDQQWTDAFGTVFLGTVRLIRTLAPAMSDGGSIALVLSTSVKSPIPNLAISNGLRPGLAMLAKTFADELGPTGVRVNALLPGSFNTERTKQLRTPGAAMTFDHVPLRRIGEPEEFGRVAAMVLSPAASYVTGAAIPVDGGSLRAL